MMTWEVKWATSLAGSFLELEVANPRLRSYTTTFFMLKLKLSLDKASRRDSWCISTNLTSIVNQEGHKVTITPGFRAPVSTCLTRTIPIPPILYTSWRGRCSGLFEGLLGLLIMSKASRKVEPLYQSRLADLSIISSPSKPYLGVLWCRGVLIVIASNHLLHTKSESKRCMLTGWSILGDISFKTTSGGINPAKEMNQSQLWHTKKKRWPFLS